MLFTASPFLFLPHYRGSLTIIINKCTQSELEHHDSVPSGGRTWLRSLKVCELEYNADGSIKTIEGGGK
jgi:hypothetical protein